MTTTTILPIQAVAQRSAVQKTFVDATLLSGFTDAAHFEMLCGEYLTTLDHQDAAAVRSAAASARSFVATLPASNPVELADFVRQPIQGSHIAGIVADPVFQQSFGGLPHQFAHVELSRLAALQPWVEPRRDVVPTDEQGLLDFCLPRNWEVPAELSYLPQSNAIQVLSSDPALSGLKVDFDQALGKVTLAPPLHPNLIQVAAFNGRAYLRNGYHRVVDALAQGLTTLPAIIVYPQIPDHVLLPAAGCFNLFPVMAMPRPPMLSDFSTSAAITTRVRERRYGLIVTLDIKPFNIGV